MGFVREGSTRRAKRERQELMHKITEAVRSYPLKRRALFALTMCASLFIATMNWHFEPAKVIAICAATGACLFDLKGKWFMFLGGICVGDMLLYLFR
jgi:hypothetical protein